MGKIVLILIFGGLILGLVRLMAAPIRLAWKLLVNGLAGLMCLWLVNLVSSVTGLMIPINPVTAVTAGFLGLPGILLLAIIQIWF